MPRIAQRNHRIPWILALGIVSVLGTGTAMAHFILVEAWRFGAPPHYPGQGWIGEAYLLPENFAPADPPVSRNLIAAEDYITDNKLQPDFTFRTDWIDFPAGPVGIDLDENFATVGDFLDDYIYDVSDPSKLDEPFGHMLIRFTGYMRFLLEDDTFQTQAFPDGKYGLSVWIEMMCHGLDGFRLRVLNPANESDTNQSTVYRLPLNNPNLPFFHDNVISEGLGLFKVQVTYFNVYDPDSTTGRQWAGFELYSWHGGGLPWPAGNLLVHATRGPATILPPWVVYQQEDVQPLMEGDYDVDLDVDLIDFQWFQKCFSYPGEEKTADPRYGCEALDFDKDLDVELDDFQAFLDARTAPWQANSNGG